MNESPGRPLIGGGLGAGDCLARLAAASFTETGLLAGLSFTQTPAHSQFAVFVYFSWRSRFRNDRALLLQIWGALLTVTLLRGVCLAVAMQAASWGRRVPGGRARPAPWEGPLRPRAPAPSWALTWRSRPGTPAALLHELC